MYIFSWTYIKEKWTHVGFQKYFRNMGWSFSGKVFSLLMSLFVGVLVARYLGPERYGVLNYAISFVTIFFFLASFGIDNILVRDLIKYREKNESILNTAFVIKIVGGILTILIATTASILVKNDFYTTILVFIYSLQLLFIPIIVTDAYFQSILKYKYSFAAQFISTLSVSILKLYLVYVGLGTGWFVLALVFEITVSTFVQINIFTKIGRQIKFDFNYNLAKKMISDGWPFILNTAFILIYTKIDQVLVGKMIGTTSLGIYSAGVKLAEMWYFIPATICGVLFPAIINAKIIHNDLYRARLKKIFLLIILLSFFIALFEFIFAKQLIYILFGQVYMGSVVILKIYTWAGIIVAIITIMQQYLIIENKTKIIMYSSLVGAATNVILNLLFIPPFGIIGSAWATVISYTIIPIFIFISTNINLLKTKCEKNV